VSLSANRPIPLHVRVQICRRASLCLRFASPPDSLRTVRKPRPSTTFKPAAKGVVDEAMRSDPGTKKTFVELILKSGEDKLSCTSARSSEPGQAGSISSDIGQGTRERHGGASLFRQ